VQTVKRDWYRYVRESGIDNCLPFLRSYFGYYEITFRTVVAHTPPRGRILEVGAGTGLFGLWLAASGFKVTQIDIDERIIQLARENIRRYNVPTENIKIVHGDALELPRFFGPDSFDLSITRGLLEHFDASGALQILKSQATI
jgi:2-polyprenyl-3-methyl-5-hydroxy-6-metoxy-1,4-benzoquinol methylase